MVRARERPASMQENHSPSSSLVLSRQIHFVELLQNDCNHRRVPFFSRCREIFSPSCAHIILRPTTIVQCIRFNSQQSAIAVLCKVQWQTANVPRFCETFSWLIREFLFSLLSTASRCGDGSAEEGVTCQCRLRNCINRVTFISHSFFAVVEDINSAFRHVKETQ